MVDGLALFGHLCRALCGVRAVVRKMGELICCVWVRWKRPVLSAPTGPGCGVGAAGAGGGHPQGEEEAERDE